MNPRCLRLLFSLILLLFPGAVADSRAASDGLTLEQVKAVIAKIKAVYLPEIEAGGRTLEDDLEPDSSGDSPTTNGESDQHWVIQTLGGFFKRSDMDEDTFALSYCHELGHHLGGAPIVTSFLAIPIAKDRQFITVDGQADYFATAKCFPRAFSGEDNTRFLHLPDLPPRIRDRCVETFGDSNRAGLCIRSSLASLKLTQIILLTSRVNLRVSVDAADPEVVTDTIQEWPSPQCRLDTYLAGALCKVSPEIGFSRLNSRIGACNEEQPEAERPRCWYKPPTQLK